MSTEEQVALDALSAIGIDGVSIFHMRCIAAFFASAKDTKRRDDRLDRLTFDLGCVSVDEVHIEAEWENARWMAQRSAQRSLRPLIQATVDGAEQLPLVE